MSRQLEVGTLSYQFIDRYLVYTFNNITYKKMVNLNHFQLLLMILKNT